MQQVISELQAASVGDILFNEPLAPYTTWEIGGPADIFIMPGGKKELADTIRILHGSGIPWTTIGKGSNLLVSDKGIRGVVIKLGRGFDSLTVEGERIRVGAAYGTIKLSVMAGKHGLTGLEFAGGIPGMVGGAVYMNAGAHGSDVSQVLESAEVVLDTGQLVSWTAEEMQFSYRHSILHATPGIITEAVFKLAYGNRTEIAAAMASFKDRRLRTQPFTLACAGSVFRNPDGHHAAKLIEQAGLKGLRVGGAEISMQHANFIVNTDQATAEDVLTLMKQVQAIVQKQFGIQLVPEVLVVGER